MKRKTERYGIVVFSKNDNEVRNTYAKEQRQMKWTKYEKCSAQTLILTCTHAHTQFHENETNLNVLSILQLLFLCRSLCMVLDKMETFLSTSKDNSYVQFWFGSVAEHMRAKVSFQCICNLWAFSHWKFSKSFVLTCNILKCAHFRGYAFVQVCVCVWVCVYSCSSFIVSFLFKLNSTIRLFRL